MKEKIYDRHLELDVVKKKSEKNKKKNVRDIIDYSSRSLSPKAPRNYNTKSINEIMDILYNNPHTEHFTVEFVKENFNYFKAILDNKRNYEAINRRLKINIVSWNQPQK